MGILSANRETEALSKAMRTRFVDRGGKTGSPEMLVKVISSTRSRNQAGNLVRYVARVREGDQSEPRVSLYAGTGDQLLDGESLDFSQSKKAAQAVFENFGLEYDSENVTADGQLKSPIIYHLTASYPVVENLKQVAAVEQAVGAAVQDLFQSKGYPAIWAMHNCPRASEPDHRGDGHGDVHVHILVRARSDNPHKDRLRFDRSDLEALRSVFTFYGQDAGLDVEASRVSDRQDVRDWVARDDVAFGRVNSGRYDGLGNLSVRAPGWDQTVRSKYPAPERAAYFDAAFELDPIEGQKQESDERVDPVVQRIFMESYEDPAAAAHRWYLLRAELKSRERKDSLAHWYLKHQPGVYGLLKVDGSLPAEIFEKTRVSDPEMGVHTLSSEVERHIQHSEIPERFLREGLQLAQVRYHPGEIETAVEATLPRGLVPGSVRENDGAISRVDAELEELGGFALRQDSNNRRVERLSRIRASFSQAVQMRKDKSAADDSGGRKTRESKVNSRTSTDD